LNYNTSTALFLLVLFACSPTSETPNKQTAISIILKNDCLQCHGIEERVVGPSYLDIALRYDNSTKVKNDLITKIKNGGGGKWYGGMMSKHPFLKQHELNTLAKWILSVDNMRTASLKAIDRPNRTANTASLTYYQLNQQPNQLNKAEKGLQSLSSQDIDQVNLVGESSQPNFIEGTLVLFNGIKHIKTSGKYFFALDKTNRGMLLIDNQTIVRDSPDDKELPVDLEPGIHEFKIYYVPESRSDTLALRWIAPGMEYYELMVFD
jgi:cytochrome c